MDNSSDGGSSSGAAMSASTTPSSRMPDALAGAALLAIGMGFGRFSFTGLYPSMVQDGFLTISAGSLVASANYLGYLIGALMMSRVQPARSARIGQWAMIGTAVCLAALTLRWGIEYILAVRFLAGIFSAFAMVGASIWLFQIIGFQQGAPTLYAGVGVGILLSAELIACGHIAGIRSVGLWSVLAVAATVLSVPAWLRMGRKPSAPSADTSAPIDSIANAQPAFRPWILIGIYGLAGFGYIVTATYLPLLVKNALGQIDPVQVWAAFGFGAIPSCFLWHALSCRLGSRRSLLINLLVQAGGVTLPIVSATPSAFFTSAVLVGGTFVGTVTIAMPAAKRAASTMKFNMMAMMTAAYGIGQILGPLLSSALITQTQSFDSPLLIAGTALLVAALACLL